MCLVGAGRGLVAVVLVDDDGVGDVLHHDVLEPQVPREARASLKETARVGAGGCGWLSAPVTASGVLPASS